DRSFFRVRHGSLLGGIVRSFAGDVGDQAFLKGDLLEHSWACSDVRHEAIDLHHPDHRAVVHATRQRPMMIELRNLEHGADGFRFALAGAFAHPKALSMAVSFMCGFRLLSSRKLTQPMVRIIPQAQVSGLPPSKGEGRLRASFSAKRRHRTAYSSLSCSRQNWSVIATISSRTGPTSTEPLLVGLRFAISYQAWSLCVRRWVSLSPSFSFLSMHFFRMTSLRSTPFDSRWSSRLGQTTD